MTRLGLAQRRNYRFDYGLEDLFTSTGFLEESDYFSGFKNQNLDKNKKSKNFGPKHFQSFLLDEEQS